MTKKRDWLLREDGVLCLDGYPIRILQTPNADMPFKLESDGMMALPYWTLALAKMDGNQRADELDEFTA